MTDKSITYRPLSCGLLKKEAKTLQTGPGVYELEDAKPVFHRTTSSILEKLLRQKVIYSMMKKSDSSFNRKQEKYQSQIFFPSVKIYTLGLSRGVEAGLVTISQVY